MQQKNCVLLPPKTDASLSSLLSSLFSLLERKRELEHERRTTAAVLPQAPPPLRTSSAARGLFLRGAGAGGAGGREKARSSNSFADGRRQRRRSADFAPPFPASSSSAFSARSSPLPPADARRGLFPPGRGAGRAPGARHGAERRGCLREGGDGGGGDDDLLFVSFSFFSGSSAPALPLLFPRPFGPLHILALFACLISKGDGGRKRNNKG